MLNLRAPSYNPIRSQTKKDKNAESWKEEKKKPSTSKRYSLQVSIQECIYFYILKVLRHLPLLKAHTITVLYKVLYIEMKNIEIHGRKTKTDCIYI